MMRKSSEGTRDGDAVELENFRKRLKWCHRNCPAQINQLVLQSDNPEMYKEEARRYKQAKLGKYLNLSTARRLKQRQFFYKEYYPEWTMSKGYTPEEEEEEEEEEEGCAKKSPPPPVSYIEDLQLETHDSKIAKLTDVALRYSTEEKEYNVGSGTLEAHVNGFRYTVSSPILQIDFNYKNVKHAFFRPKDELMPLLLHFNLHEPVNVEGNLKANDIQFQFGKTLVGHTRSDDNSNEIEKEKDFQMFVEKVQAKWNPHILPFEVPLKKHEFHGSLGVFFVTTFCLAGIERTPFFVVALTEIEFVNLANLRPGEINMTVVLKDFTRNVFEISSVPSASVAVIKDWFDILGVKYYENKEKHEWNDILQGIRENPQDFIDKGCWRSVNLESSAAAEVSSDSYQSSESESDFEEEEFPWDELFEACRSNSMKRRVKHEEH